MSTAPLIKDQVGSIDITDFVETTPSSDEKPKEDTAVSEPIQPSESSSRRDKKKPVQSQQRTTIIVHKPVLDELNKIKFVQRLEATHVDSNSEILEKALACLVKSLPEKQRATYQRLFQNRE